MRLSEAFLLFTTFLLGVAAILSPASFRGAARSWLVIPFTALAIHFFGERLYWQIAPCYLACLLLAVVVLLSTRLSSTSIRLLVVFSLLLLIASAGSLLVVPKFRLPVPTGPYAVGTRLIHLTDPARSDTTFKSGKRELMAQAWYPTDQRSGTRASYRSWEETTPISSYDSVLLTHSFKDAPVARDGASFPLILFNPAWNGQRTQNTFQMEELASHGFIVVAIDHTHNSTPVAFPDGQVVRVKDMQSIDDFSDVTLEHQIALGDKEVRQQAADDSLFLDALTEMASDPASMWYRAVDLNRVGALGHSFGGAVAIQTAFQDPRVHAAMNLDGWTFGDLWQRPLNKPTMLLYEDDYPPTQAEIDATQRSGDHQSQLYLQLTLDDLKNVERSLAAGGGYEVFIEGAKHMNFCDRALYSPLRRFTSAGNIDAVRAFTIINQYTVAFFSHTLKGTQEPLLQETKRPFPEARLKIWPTGETAAR
jgi:pimeloyl-ACP methyl ester carboxylesterase